MDLNRFEQLGARVAEELERVPDPGPDAALRRSLARRTASANREPVRRLGGWRAPALALFAAAAAALPIALWLRAPEPVEAPPLSFRVGLPEHPGVLGEWISAPDATDTPLSFSDGSRVVLESSSQGRVVRLAAQAAEVVLEAGRANVSVVPRPGNHWRVRSGPFVVDVKGTRFDVAWDPARDVFEVELYEGKVTIAGCGLGTGQALRAGQRVRASCKAGTVAIGSLTTPSVPGSEPSASSTGTEPSRATAHEAVPEASQRVVAQQSAASDDWVSLARRGFHERAFALAEARGLDNERRARSANDLLLLGEVARLSGHVPAARVTYEEVRRRFSGGAAPARAAFELGRLEASARRSRSAAAWFETYLREQPSGALATAARGRLLEALVALGDGERATAAARAYLESSPSGPHADAARQVLEGRVAPAGK